MTTNSEKEALGKKLALDLLLVGSWNLSNLAVLLQKSASGSLSASCAPHGQFMQTMLDPGTWNGGANGAVIWTTPDAAIGAFNRLVGGEVVSAEDIQGDVDSYCASILALPASVKHIFVPTWVVGSDDAAMGPLDMDPKMGASAALMRMNLRLADNLVRDPRVAVLDASRWVGRVGEKSFSARLWYMSKTPYGTEFLKEAAAAILGAIDARAGRARKLIVLDLDDTLWGGIVGDVGWQQLRLGGHDMVGEAYCDFQSALKALKKRGILLAIVSKNEEATALEAIRSSPEMILRLDDFVAWRINWDDKAKNILEIAKELNLGLQSVVFIDDNSAERDRVRAALPELLVPEWPPNPLEYKSALQRLRCFDQAQISAEDRERSAMYQSERQRSQSAAQFQSVDDWLMTLDLKVAAEKVGKENLERATQLFNKTNQMNLSTRRLTAQELLTCAEDPGAEMLAFRVSDKFGDYGLVGLASVTVEKDRARIVDFILSCRVMGRKVEQTILHALSGRARARGAKSLVAEYLPTAKNQPCLALFKSIAPQSDGQSVFTFLLDEPYPKPACVSLTMP